MATFGTTSVGGSAQFAGQPSACKFTAPENGDITAITVRAANFGASASIGVAVYADSAGDPGSKLAEDSGNQTITSSTPAWYTLNLAQAITSGTPYWLAVWFSLGDCAWYYDAGDTGQTRGENGETFETWPGSYASIFSFDRNVSIYATYTPAASGNRRRRLLLCGSK